MSSIAKALFALAAATTLAACASREEEVVYVEPEPVAAEPSYTKY